MHRFIFRLPDLGEGVAEAEIAAWHVRQGERVEEDQPLLDVLTDKASVEVTSPVAGTVAIVSGAVGDRLPVGTVLVEIDIGGDADVAEPTAAPEAALLAAALPATPPPPKLAAPATRNRARELGIALEAVEGTGPDGRILATDLDAFLARRREAASTQPDVRDVRITGLRRRIAERMEEASRIPHLGYVEQFDLTELEALRRELNDTGTPAQPKLTLLPFFMRALVRVLPEFPEINAHYDGNGVLRCAGAVHIGIATQTGSGLMVPVVHHAERLDLWACARELARVAAAARDGSATAAELTGSTITLTSLGPLGGLAAMPIINRPEVAIIAPNKLERRPLVIEGQVVVRTAMNVSSAFDHRIVDGHVAARFIQGLKRLLERPALLFIDRPSA